MGGAHTIDLCQCLQVWPISDRARMKFNDKELALWASSLISDKEGLLDKKGAGRGQGKREGGRAIRTTP